MKSSRILYPAAAPYYFKLQKRKKVFVPSTSKLVKLLFVIDAWSGIMETLSPTSLSSLSSVFKTLRP
jgi:hypothetical protein